MAITLREALVASAYKALGCKCGNLNSEHIVNRYRNISLDDLAAYRCILTLDGDRICGDAIALISLAKILLLYSTEVYTLFIAFFIKHCDTAILENHSLSNYIMSATHKSLSLPEHRRFIIANRHAIKRLCICEDDEQFNTTFPVRYSDTLLIFGMYEMIPVIQNMYIDWFKLPLSSQANSSYPPYLRIVHLERCARIIQRQWRRYAICKTMKQWIARVCYTRCMSPEIGYVIYKHANL